jgi:excisionase family DNA binding protein
LAPLRDLCFSRKVAKTQNRDRWEQLHSYSTLIVQTRNRVLTAAGDGFEKGRKAQTMFTNREPLMTTAAVSKWLGISTRTLCLWAECKEIPAIKVGRQWRFRESELANWLRDPEGAKARKFTFAQAGAGQF